MASRVIRLRHLAMGSSIKDVHSEEGRGLAQVQTNADKGEEEFDSVRTSATQYCTKACGVSCHPYSDGCGCTKWTAQFARRLLCVAPWSVAC